MVERWIADSELSTKWPIYTRANVGEVFPDPVTPFARDTGIWLAELGWRYVWARVGAFDHEEFDPDNIEQLGITGGYCYLNASLIRLFGERAPGLSVAAMDGSSLARSPASRRTRSSPATSTWARPRGSARRSGGPSRPRISPSSSTTRS